MDEASEPAVPGRASTSGCRLPLPAAPPRTGDDDDDDDDDDGDGDGDGDGAPRERGVELWSTSPSSSRGCSLSTPRWAGDRWARELEWVFASTGGWPWRPRCLGCC